MVSVFLKRVAEVAVGGLVLLILTPHLGSLQSVSDSANWLATQVAVLAPTLSFIWPLVVAVFVVAALIGVAGEVTVRRYPGFAYDHPGLFSRALRVVVVLLALLFLYTLAVNLCVDLGAWGLIGVAAFVAFVGWGIRRAIWLWRRALY